MKFILNTQLRYSIKDIQFACIQMIKAKMTELKDAVIKISSSKIINVFEHKYSCWLKITYAIHTHYYHSEIMGKYETTWVLDFF